MQMQLNASIDSGAQTQTLSSSCPNETVGAHFSGTIGDSKCLKKTAMDASIFLDKVQTSNAFPPGLEECCICMENRAEVSLPCAHSYCLPCIEQW